MIYQCNHCGREFDCELTISFCPFCGKSYFAQGSVSWHTPSQTPTVQKIVVGSDGERTIQEKYWMEAQKQIGYKWCAVRLTTPRYNEERPEEEYEPPEEFLCENVTVDTLMKLRKLKSLSSFQMKLDRNLKELRKAMKIRGDIAYQIKNRQDRANAESAQISWVITPEKLAEFEDEYSIQVSREEEYIQSFSALMIEKMNIEIAEAEEPVLHYDPIGDDWMERKEYEEDILQVEDVHVQLMDCILHCQASFVQMLNQNSVYVLSAIPQDWDEDLPDDDQINAMISELKKLDQEDYDPIFGEAPEKYVTAYMTALFYLADFVDALPTYEDWMNSDPEKDPMYYARMLDQYKLQCLRSLATDWESLLEKKLDAIYQARSQDMMALSGRLEQVKLPNVEEEE